MQQISEQVVKPGEGSEPDTLVEPDVAVSPRNPKIAVAVAHEGRFPDGGATSISHAWTRDGGRTWKHATVPFLTKAAGGVWDRVSDPVVAFAADGTLYLSTIVLNVGADDCDSAVLVSRSTDGGASFEPPVAAQATDDCAIFNDKNWITVDTGRRSIYRGRVYQFWTYFLGNDTAQQRMRYSDDRGRTWSKDIVITPGTAQTQNAQPVIQSDGKITLLYLDYEGTGRVLENPRAKRAKNAAAAKALAKPLVGARAAVVQPGTPMRARTSRDGGRNWSAPVLVADTIGAGPDGIRCCLSSATVDPVTDRIHTAWTGNDVTQVWTTSSTDGRTWGKARSADTRRKATDEIVNVDVAAYQDKVLVSFGRRDTTKAAGRFVRQQLALSSDAGAHFRAPLTVGPPSDLRYGAQAGGAFPGDYIGTAAARGRFYAVWAVGAKPPVAGDLYRQVLYGAVIKP